MRDDPGDCGPILVADDDPQLRALVTTLFGDVGYATVEAADGEAALRAARRGGLSALVLDVEMPRLSGYEVCARVRQEQGAGIPILFISGERTDAIDRVAGLMLGADDFLVKPFAPEELLARVRSLLRRSSPRPRANGLTPREVEILELVADGLVQPQIAARLHISPKTVGSHMERILAKLDARSRAHAVARAYDDGLIGRRA
jgi:DNA-binding response OmpR family regulator